MYAVLGALILSCSFSFKVFAFNMIAYFYIHSYFRVIDSSFCKILVLKSLDVYMNIKIFDYFDFDLIIAILLV